MTDTPVLTGQVQANPPWPACGSHKEVAHDIEGHEEHRYCNRCGWNRVLGVRIGSPSGGWGTRGASTGT